MYFVLKPAFVITVADQWPLRCLLCCMILTSLPESCFYIHTSSFLKHLFTCILQINEIKEGRPIMFVKMSRVWVLQMLLFAMVCFAILGLVVGTGAKRHRCSLVDDEAASLD